MAGRLITIEITGDEKGYQASVNRIAESNRRLNRDAIAGAEKWSASIVAIERSLGGIAARMTGLLGLGALVGIGKQAVDVAGQLQDLADQTGITAKTLSGLKVPAEQVGVSIEEFAQGVLRLQKSVVNSDKDTSRFADRLRDLRKYSGDSEKFLEEFAKSLDQIKNPAERTAFALDAASRAGGRLGPLFQQIAEQGLDKFRNSANSMSNETIKALDALGDSATSFKNQVINAFGEAIAAQGNWTEAIEDAGKKVAEWTKFIIENKEAILLLAAGLAFLTGQWYAAAAAGAAFIASLGGATETEKELAKIEQERLVLNQQIQAAATMRDKGVRTGIASEEIYQELLKKGNDLLTRREDLMDKTVSERMTHTPATTAAPAISVDPKMAEKEAQALAALQGKILQLRSAMAEAARAHGDYSGAAREAALAIIEHEHATAIATAAQNNMLPALRKSIDTIAELQRAQLAAKEADLARKEALDLLKRSVDAEAQAEANLADVRQASDRDAATLRQQQFDAVELERDLALEQTNRLGIIGRTQAAERARLEAQIKYLEKIKALEEATPGGKDTSLRAEQIKTLQTQMQQLGTVSVDVGRHITDSLSDIFRGMLQGTLKGVDVVKSAGATFGKIVADMFDQFITKKLGFENLLFTNLKGLPNQANNALTNGMQSIPGGGGGNLGSLGDLFGTLFNAVGGRGGAAAGVEGPLMESGNFLSGGGGGLSSIISNVGGVASRVMPAGTTLGGALGGAFAGYGIGSMINGQRGGIAGAIGGAGASLIGGSTAIGGALGLGAGASIGTALTASLTGALTPMLGAMIGAMVASLMTSFIIPGIGIIIMALMSLLSKPPDPAIFVKTSMVFYYDQINEAFNQMTKTSLIKIQGDVKKSQIKKVLAEHQDILSKEADRWVDVLNNFPIFVHEQMMATLDSANEMLDAFFGRKKYSEGGKRNIKQELEDLKTKEAPRGIFTALRETIGAGFGGTLEQAGLFNAAEAARQAFQPGNLPGGMMIPTGSKEQTDKFVDALTKLITFTGGLTRIGPRGNMPVQMSQAQMASQYLLENPDVAAAAEGYYLQTPTRALEHYRLFGRAEGRNLPGQTDIARHYLEDYPDVAAAAEGYYLTDPLKHYRDFGRAEGRQLRGAGGVSSLGGVSTFLTSADLARLEGEFETVFATAGEEFPKAVDDMLERIKPLTEFIQKAMEEASQIFGKGLLAALEAATESDAKAGFLNALNVGIKETIFSGIIESFIASAQFTDLLAPIQKTIREFTQEALATGELPSVEKFRSAILPGIEEITTRAELLTPLITELQNLGFSIKEILGLNEDKKEAPITAAPPIVQNITLYINANKEDMDPRTLAREIGDAIGGLLPPPQ